MIPIIRITHLTDRQKRAFRLADNKFASMSTWDDELLVEELQFIMQEPQEVNILATGFDVKELDFLVHGQTTDTDDQADTVPKIVRVHVTRLGDVWQLGDHRLICGDATKTETYRVVFGNVVADVIFTDPPYNVKVDGHVSGLGANKHREFPMASGEMSTDEFRNFLSIVFELMASFSRDGSLHYVCMDWRHIEDVLATGGKVYSALKNICVWVKDNGGMGSLYRSRHEMVTVFKNGHAPHLNNVELGKHGRNRTNVWEYPSANTFSKSSEEGRLNELHPTVKPVKMVADALLDCSKPGDIVLDPFAGSGTTFIAAERVRRVCYGMELDPGYCDVIIRRWEAWTGQRAIHAETGKTFQQLTDEGEADHGED
jgi:DNA modification methylase